MGPRWTHFPFAVLFQWFADDSNSSHVLEWLFLRHKVTKTVWTVSDMFAQLIMEGCEQLQMLSSQDPHVIHVPVNKENLSRLLSEDTNFQIALPDFLGQLSIHYPSHRLWTEVGSLPLYVKRHCSLTPIDGMTVFTDASSRTSKAAIVWCKGDSAQWH